MSCVRQVEEILWEEEEEEKKKGESASKEQGHMESQGFSGKCQGGGWIEHTPPEGMLNVG